MDKCRLCYTDPKPEMCQHIFNTKSQPPIWQIIEQLSNLIITKNDPYTKNICGQCFIDLLKYSDFRRQILETDYRIQHEKKQLIEKTNDDCNDFEVHFTSTTSDNDDFMIKEEQIKIEDDPLKFDDEIKEDTKEIAIVDGINNNDKITAYYTNPVDNSNETNEKQSNQRSTDDKIVFTRDSTETDGSYTISTNNNDLSRTDNDGNDISNVKDIVGSGSKCNKQSTDEADLCRHTKSYRCNICDRRLSRKTNLLYHLRRHTGEKPYKCQLCNKQFTQNTYLRIHQRLHTDNKPFKCTICDKQFARKTSLWHHQRLHTSEKRFKCTICKKQFSQKTSLLRHQRLHTGEKPYQCEICKKQFAQKTNLVCHERVHTGEKPFKCTICCKQFADKANLVRHQRLHTGEKPFKCNICNQQFSIKRNLLKHEQVHTGDKPYKCEICKKCFSRKENLLRHKRIHTDDKPFKCNICDKSFSTRGYLKDHLNQHTGAKPYCCSVCDLTFMYNSALHVHLKAHKNGKKQFECDFCKKQFVRKCHLKTHLTDTHTLDDV